MSLFCISCQVTRTLISRSTRAATAADQLIHKNFHSFRNYSSSVTLTATRFNERQLLSYSRAEVGHRSKQIRGGNHASSSWMLWSPEKRRSQGFCTKTKSGTKAVEVKLGSSSEGGEVEEEDEEFLRRLTSTAELEESLTEEEREILRELEAEERRFREKLSSGQSDEEDYYVWDGSFDGGSSDSSKLASSVSEGHKPFQNRQRIIQDVIEEMWNPLPQQIEEAVEPEYFPRGRTGVFDLGELVDLLREENAGEVVVITLPKEIDYADYMVIVTVGNNKHLVALATFIRKRFKMKDLKPTDVLPVLDKSVNHQGWIALDLGNIILHIFLQNTRDYYDLETLWTVGPLFDDLTNAPDAEIVQLLNTIK